MVARYSVTRIGGKSLPSETNDAARSYVRALVTSEFGGNATAAARAFRTTQSTLCGFLEGRRGGGMKLLSLIATYAGVSLDVVLGRRPEAPALEAPPALAQVLAASTYLPETIAQLRLYASFNAELPAEQWKRLGDGYDRENREVIDRMELATLRARRLTRAPLPTKRARS